jgi:hypothetical protein
MSYGQDVLTMPGKPFSEALHQGALPIQDLIAKYPYLFAFDLIKDPNFALWAGDLMDAFPDAVSFAIVRDPRQNIRSIFDRVGLDGRVSDISRVRFDPNIPKPWISYLKGEYHNNGHQNPVRVAAKRWSQINEAILAHKDRIKIIKYENFVLAKEESILDLLYYAGFSHENEINDLVDVQFQPAGRTKIAPLQFFGDKNYAEIVKCCYATASKLGYTL